MSLVSVSGSTFRAGESIDVAWQNGPGDYVLRLLKDDGDEVMAESSVFTVRWLQPDHP